MAFLQFCENKFIVALNREVYFIEDDNISFTLKLDDTKAQSPTIKQDNKEPDLDSKNTDDGIADVDEKSENTTSTSSKKNSPDKSDNDSCDHDSDKASVQFCNIITLAISQNVELFAVAGNNEKFIHLGCTQSESDKQPKILNICQVKRIPSAMKFSLNSKNLVVADRSGDCYIFDNIMQNLPRLRPRWILGHCSMVLDILLSEDERCILSCDRDEKIRISKFPETYIIERYCLGHTDFVSNIEFLPTTSESVIISTSGDNTIKLWNYLEGYEINNFCLFNAAPIKLTAKKFDDITNHVAVILYGSTATLSILEIKLNDDKQTYDCKELFNENMSNIKSIQTCLFNKVGELFLTGVTLQDDNVIIKKIIYENDKYIEMEVNALNDVITKLYLPIKSKITVFDHAILFKKKYDNLTEYYQKKKRRIDDKKK